MKNKKTEQTIYRGGREAEERWRLTDETDVG